jgi:hypothetical protein
MKERGRKKGVRFVYLKVGGGEPGAAIFWFNGIVNFVSKEQSPQVLHELRLSEKN